VRPDSRASKAHVIGQEAKNRIVSKLHSLLARFILRRTKDEVQLFLP
jgi:SNF2 family DNA or RNA helicase